MKTLEAIIFVIKKALFHTKKLFITLLASQIFTSLSSSLVDIFTFKEIIEAVNGNKTIFDLNIMQIIILRYVIIITTTIIERYSNYIRSELLAKQTNASLNDFVEKVRTLDLAVFENSQTVGQINRAFVRCQLYIKAYLENIIQVVSVLTRIIASLVVFIFASPIATLLILVSNVIVIIVRNSFNTSYFNIYKSNDEEKRRFGYATNTILQRETLTEIKIFQAFDFIKQKIISIFEKYTQKELDNERKYQGIIAAAELLPIFSTLFFVISIVTQLQNKIITNGQFVFYFTNIFILGGGLNQFSKLYTFFNSEAHMLFDLIDFYKIKPRISFIKPPKDLQELLKKKLDKPVIVFKSVSFHYPNSQSLALNKINLTIPYGQNLAIIGENGAGKTTLTKLLMRMYDPTEGAIYINDVNLNLIPEKILFNLYSVLFQSFGKFNFTFKENLEMAANRKLNDDEMKKYLLKANAWEFIKDLEKGVNQQLGPEYKDGIDLSGGQWQRLGIARALSKKAPILILDEPTSAVDAKAETEIFDRLNKETKENTVIFISHRFSTIKDAERIIVLDKGKIIEDGTHLNLIKANLKYATLYNLQAERYLR